MKINEQKIAGLISQGEGVSLEFKTCRNQINRDVYETRIHIYREWSRIMPTSHFLVGLSTILILWFGGNMVLRGEMTLGEMVAFNGYLIMIAEPARQLVWLVNIAGEAGAGLKRSFDVLDQPSEIESPPDAVVLPSISGRVEFQNVNFRYKGEAGNVLQDINLVVFATVHIHT